ncbi:MAG: cellulose biosynthesis cyclic di-GMP-binding regulatory protein BcsB [Anaerolineales bacterium]|nr:cellulose biosynthesis cyclic di-GMP-binding regulatory protein BcsB [Anaerolineales bacterium]MDW8278075.1 cellulose biosynthesis cyclic di-GMP-binding regulatory protein BcsB [Anaerolineales bacterium]
MFSFSQLGYVERIMLSPYDTTQLSFGLPATWALTADSAITLRLNFASSRAGVSNTGEFPGGTLRVSFNGVILRTILLSKPGDFVETIPLSPESLRPIAADGRHRLSFIFDARFACDDRTISSSLVISDSSTIALKHQTVPIEPDLTVFPRPFYQPGSILPSQTFVVIPDAPSEAELRAALLVSAGLGALTGGNLTYRLIPVAQFPAVQNTPADFILVGLPGLFSLLEQVRVPYPLQQGAWAVSGMGAEDGLLQIAVSPWNPGHVALVVSGNSEVGLVKAAQALSAGKLVASVRRDVSVISQVNPTALDENVPQDQSLLSLGYENTPLGGFDGTYAAFFFPASADQVLSLGGYVDMVVSSTNLLDAEKSGMTVFLNGKFLGSLRFTGQTEQVTTTRLQILPGMLRRGSNLLEVYSDLIPIYDCFSPDLSGNTVVISSLTNIHLPVTAQQIELGTLQNLGDFPSLLTTDRSLRDLAFVLARNDPTGWEIASKLAFFIGRSASIPVASLQMAYADAVSEELLKNYHLILVGAPGQLPFLKEINAQLPAPFDLETGQAVQPALLVNYRLLPGVNVGYLQMLSSPWKQGYSILLVSGNSEAGVPMAAQTLLTPARLSQLKGNFAIVYNEQVLTTDTRLGPAKEALGSDLPAVATVTPLPLEQTLPEFDMSRVEERPEWVLPAIIVLSVLSGLMVVVIVARALWVRRNGDKTLASKRSLSPPSGGQ